MSNGDGKGGGVVDLPRVRAALARLDAALAQGVRPVPVELVTALVAAEDGAMAAAATVAIGVRLPVALLARVDAVAGAGRGSLPGPSRNAVIAAVLEVGLPEVERQAGIAPPAPPEVPAGDDSTAELVAVLRRLLAKLERATDE